METLFTTLFKDSSKGITTFSSLFSALHRYDQAARKGWSTHVDLVELKTTYEGFSSFWNFQTAVSELYQIGRDVKDYFYGTAIEQIPPGTSIERWLCIKCFFKTAKVISNVIGVGGWLKSIGAIKSRKSIYSTIEDLTGMIGYAGAAYMVYVNRRNSAQSELNTVQNENRGEFLNLYYRDTFWDVAGNAALFACSFLSLVSQTFSKWIPHGIDKRVDDAMLFFGVLATISMIFQHFVGLESFKNRHNQI